MLRATPDVATRFDHSTLPYPTLHFYRRSTAPVKALQFHDRATVVGNELTERTDIQYSSIKIIYDYGDESGAIVPSIDIAPPGTTGFEVDGAVFTVDLQPPGTSWNNYHVDYEDIDINDIEWWQKKIPTLKDAADITVKDPHKPDRCNREVVGGAFPPYYPNAIRDAEITAKISYAQKSATGAETKYTDVPMSVNATDEVQEDWRIRDSATPGKAVPIGLAQQIFDSVKDLQYDGRISIVDEEIDPAAYHVGMLLNLFGGWPQWETARAQIQSVNYNVDAGATSIVIGPTRMLSASDLVELLRALRDRKLSGYAQSRVSGWSGGGNSKDGGQTANTKTATSSAFIEKQVMVYNDGGADGGQTTRITSDAQLGLQKIEAGNGNVIEFDAKNFQIKMYNPSVNDGQDGVFFDGSGWLQVKKGGKQIYLHAADVTSEHGTVRVKSTEYCDGKTEKMIDVVTGEPI